MASANSNRVAEIVKPTRLTFAYAPEGSAEWEGGAAELERRDLKIADASEETVGMVHLRAAAAGSIDELGSSDAEFYFLFVLEGEAELEPPGSSEPVRLGPGDSFFQRTPGAGLRLSHGETFSAFEIVGQGVLADIASRLGIEGKAREDLPGEPIVSRDTPANFLVGNGPRAFFAYRDLGVAEGTDRLVHIQHIRLGEQPPESGTGWHVHSMDQFFFQVGGEQRIAVEAQGRVTFRVGDAMAIPATTRHNVDGFSDDYSCVEICIPADYDTIPMDAPTA